MQLHPARARRQAPLQLRDRIRVRIDTTERNEPILRFRPGGEHGIVRRPVACAFHQREHHSPPAHQRERSGEFGWCATPPIGVVPAQVRVRIHHTQSRQPIRQAAKPRQQELIRVHATTTLTEGSSRASSF
jgi:hypothetical protein